MVVFTGELALCAIKYNNHGRVQELLEWFPRVFDDVGAEEWIQEVDGWEGAEEIC